MVEERLRYAIRFLSRHSKDFSLKEWRQINNPNYTKLLTLPIIGEIPISCYDATLFGSAKDGCLFTTHGIHIHNSGDKNKPFIAYKDIKSVRYHDKKIYVNDEIIKIYMITDEDKQKSVCEMIEKLKSIFTSAD